jgi:tetratricopeptide (TPR) repeat protein
MATQAASIVLCIVVCPLLAQAQAVTVRGVPGPGEPISRSYIALADNCRRLVHERANPADAVAACKKVVDEADKFEPNSHFITRRGAYVFYAAALIHAKQYKAAMAIGDKAVAIVLRGHDDSAGCSAAYGVRGQAKAFAGDLAGADKDLEQAEAYERNGLNSPAGQELKSEYSGTLKGLLMFHAQVLGAMGNKSAAGIKREEANKL